MKISREPGRFKLDRAIIGLFVLGALALAGRSWLAEHPQHNPWAPLELDHPIGWATQDKLARLRGDPVDCRAVLDRAEVTYAALPPTGEGACRREDRLSPGSALLAPREPQMTCPVAAGLELWMRHGVEPAARDVLGTSVVRIEHLGTFTCRRIGGGSSGRFSEHATGNAIDIAGFVLEDGRTVSLLNDWNSEDEKAEFLRTIRDSACAIFGTVLSPEYNAAHADHFHLDQAERRSGAACR